MKYSKQKKKDFLQGLEYSLGLLGEFGSSPLDLVESLFFICKEKKNKMVNEKSFITIQAFMVNELQLKGNELLIYAIIHGFSQDGESEFTGSLQYLADWTNSTKQGVMKALKSLMEKQLILKNETFQNNLKFCTYKVSQYETKFNGVVNKVSRGYETEFNGGMKQSLPNNITDKITDTITNNIDTKHKNGTYQNVLLSDKELKKLVDELGNEKAKAVIDNFSELKEMKGYKYKSDYLAIKKWGIEAYEKRNTTSQKSNFDKNELDEKISLGEIGGWK